MNISLGYINSFVYLVLVNHETHTKHKVNVVTMAALPNEEQENQNPRMYTSARVDCGFVVSPESNEWSRLVLTWTSTPAIFVVFMIAARLYFLDWKKTPTGSFSSLPMLGADEHPYWVSCLPFLFVDLFIQVLTSPQGMDHMTFICTSLGVYTTEFRCLIELILRMRTNTLPI